MRSFKTIVFSLFALLFLSGVSYGAGFPGFSEASGNTALSYKSPAIAVMHSHANILPYFDLFPSMGINYAYTKEQHEERFKWQLLPAYAGDALLAAWLVLIYIEQNSPVNYEGRPEYDYSKLKDGLLTGFITLSGISGLLDAILSPYTAAENTSVFFEKCRTSECRDESTAYFYKDPMLAGVLTAAVPGLGYINAGRTETGIINMLGLGVGVNALVFTSFYGMYGGFSEGGSENGAKAGLNAMAISYVLIRLAEIYAVAAYTDENNTKYYEQLLCNSGSGTTLRHAKEKKDPFIAFLIAAGGGLIVPGIGNLYADNVQGTAALIALRTGGTALVAAAFNSAVDAVTRNAMFYTGAAIAALSYFYDVATAPAYTQIYNSLHFNTAGQKDGRVLIYPCPTKDGAMIKISYEF